MRLEIRNSMTCQRAPGYFNIRKDNVFADDAITGNRRRYYDRIVILSQGQLRRLASLFESSDAYMQVDVVSGDNHWDYFDARMMFCGFEDYHGKRREVWGIGWDTSRGVRYGH